MQIERIYYPVSSLGPGQRVGIWTVGCPHACYKCSNPELQISDKTKDIPVNEILNMVYSIKGKIDGFTITGGEPFIQIKQLYKLVAGLKNISTDILIYTGFLLENLLSNATLHIRKIIDLTTVLVDGVYIDNFNDGKSLRGSSNQRVHILSDAYKTVYYKYLQQPRLTQNIMVGNNVISMGLPFQDDKENIAKGMSKKGIKTYSKE